MEGTGPGSVARFVFHAQEDEVDPLNLIQANSTYNYYSASITTAGAKYSPPAYPLGRVTSSAKEFGKFGAFRLPIEKVESETLGIG